MGQGTVTPAPVGNRFLSGPAPVGDRFLAGQVWVRRACVLGLAILVAIVVLTATARYTKGDAMGQLLVSEQILQNGTIALDAYGQSYADTNWFVYPQDGHLFYYMPIGSSIAALPVVALFNMSGFGMLENDAAAQVILAALLAGIITTLLYALARQYLPFWTSLGLAAVFWFGTSLASTGATALWSHDFAVPFALMALIALVKVTEQGRGRYWPLLGVCLFMAYLSRPTMSVLVVFALAYAFVKARPAAIRTTLLIVALLAVFVLFSLNVLGSVLPPYYLPERLSSGTFWQGIAGNMVSPSRGLLTFTPFLVLLPLYAALSWRQTRSRAGLLVVALGWPIVHWIVISRHPTWHGGHAFGPRLMMDVLPGLFLAAVLLWPARFSTWPSRLLLTASLVLAAGSVYIHTHQGLYNVYSGEMWNAVPEVDGHPEVLFDWRFPQFLYDERMHADRMRAYGLIP